MITVVVVIYGNIDCSRGLIERICQQELKSKLILVDNSPWLNDLNKVAYLLNKFKCSSCEILYLRQAQNGGFAAGVNAGLKLAVKDRSSDYSILLNPDLEIDKTFLEEINEVMERRKDVDIIGCLSLKPAMKRDGWEEHTGGILLSRFWRVTHRIKMNGSEEFADAVSGCCMVIRHRLVGEIGYLDETYFMYHEDIDYCIRARKIGREVLGVSSIVVRHFCNGSSEGLARTIYYQALNKMKLIIKHEETATKASIVLFLHVVSYMLTAALSARPVDVRMAYIRAVKDFILSKEGRLIGW